MLKKLDILIGTNVNEGLNEIRGFIQICMSLLNYNFQSWSNINL